MLFGFVHAINQNLNGHAAYGALRGAFPKPYKAMPLRFNARRLLGTKAFLEFFQLLELAGI